VGIGLGGAERGPGPMIENEGTLDAIRTWSGQKSARSKPFRSEI